MTSRFAVPEELQELLNGTKPHQGSFWMGLPSRLSRSPCRAPPPSSERRSVHSQSVPLGHSSHLKGKHSPRTHKTLRGPVQQPFFRPLRSPVWRRVRISLISQGRDKLGQCLRAAPREALAGDRRSDDAGGVEGLQGSRIAWPRVELGAADSPGSSVNFPAISAGHVITKRDSHKH